jgi:hypothetical protein
MGILAPIAEFETDIRRERRIKQAIGSQAAAN